jgi:hypothetical protein
MKIFKIKVSKVLKKLKKILMIKQKLHYLKVQEKNH